MKIQIFIKTRSKVESVERQEDSTFIVRVSSPPTEGKANKRAVELLAQHFKVPKSSVRLLKGHKSRYKTFEIN